MVALICFVLAVLASPFKWKSRLEAENAALRHQLIVLRRKMPGRPWLTNNDRWSSGAADVVGLYVAPPEKAIVLCVDEKPSIQALERAQGYLKLPNGRA